MQRWFASLHATPVAADRSAPILSIIMRQAEVYGYRRKGAIPAPASGATGARGGNGSCRSPSFAVLRGCSTTTKRTIRTRRRHPPAAADRLPQERDKDPAMDRLPGRAPVPARQQDRAPDGMVVLARPRRARRASPAGQNGSFPRLGQPTPCLRRSLKISGTGCGSGQTLPMSGFTTAVTHMPALPSWPAESVTTTARLLGHKRCADDAEIRPSLRPFRPGGCGRPCRRSRQLTMPRRKRLTDTGIARLRAQAREYTVWDTQGRRSRGQGPAPPAARPGSIAAVQKAVCGRCPSVRRRYEESTRYAAPVSRRRP